ncbi:MAG: hypothetical protein GF329_09195 [Candidatus Lokiarchaeota archaeon]|nr:hypothetical protein [Candidatus Lokiarchaeota archaeon]
MREIFTKRLKIYITLNRFYDEVKIQNIEEIMILQGNAEFQSFIIRLGINKISNLEMKINYQKLLKSQELKDYAYLKLDLPENSNIYFVIRMDRYFKEIKGLLTIIKPYLEKYFEYSLEIITLFFLPAITELGIYDINDDIKKHKRTSRSIIQELQKSKKYSKEFNKIINNLIEGRIYVTPIQYQE